MTTLNINDDDFDEALLKLWTDKDYDACAAHATEVLQTNPLHFQALIYLAKIEYERDNFEQSLHYCDTIIQGKEDKIFLVWEVRARSLTRLKRYKEATESFKTALQFDPSNAPLWCELCITLFVDGRKELAMNLLDHVEEKLGHKSCFSLARGYIERADGNTTDAFLHFKAAESTLDPKSPDYEENRELYDKEARATLEGKKGTAPDADPTQKSD